MGKGGSATTLTSGPDAMFGKNCIKEAGFDVDGDGVIEEDEMLDLQRLNYSTPGGMRRGEMQVPCGGFARYATSMTNKAKAARVRREHAERQLLGSPHMPKGTLIYSGDKVIECRAWSGSDLVSGRGQLQPLVTENGVKTRVFVGQRKTDSKLKNHETKDRAKITPKVALPKKPYSPSGTANKRSPLSKARDFGSDFDDAHDAFTVDEKVDRARLHAQTGMPSPEVARTATSEDRQQNALALTSRSPSIIDAMCAFFGMGDVPTAPKTAIVSPFERREKHKESAEKCYPVGYNGSYNSAVQETNATQAETTREDLKVWKVEISAHEKEYLDHAAANRMAVQASKANAELAREEMVRARQTEAEETARESRRLHAIARNSRDADQKARNERAAQLFDQRFLNVEEMVTTLQEFSPEEASLTPRSVYAMDPESRSPRAAYLTPFEGLPDKVAKENAALFARIRNIAARTDEDLSDEAAGAARATMAAEAKARKAAKAKRLAAQNQAFQKKLADTKAAVDAGYDKTPLNPND